MGKVFIAHTPPSFERILNSTNKKHDTKEKKVSKVVLVC